MATVVICGNGEVGAAIASVLHRSGHRVVLQRDPEHASGCEDHARLEGVLAKRARRLDDLVRMVRCGRAIPIAAEPLERIVQALQPQLVVDARALAGEAPQRAAQAVLRRMAEQGLEPARAARPVRDAAWKPLGTGALIGYVGGLIGLGGAEFRLPALVGWFGVRLRAAIAANLLISLATVVCALAARLAQHEPGALAAFAWPAAMLAAGSIAGAYAGASIAAQVRRRALHRIVGTLLGALAALIALHGALPSSGSAPLGGAAGLAAGAAVGALIGLVSSLLGVAGGELLIPSFVLLFGAELKLAGTLSLAVSTPMILVALWRLRGSSGWIEALERRALLGWMAAGSVLGALAGSLSFGAAPSAVLSLILAAILAASAIKLYRG
jgi:uncharacterized membrane protein YfcA